MYEEYTKENIPVEHPTVLIALGVLAVISLFVIYLLVKNYQTTKLKNENRTKI